VIGFEVDFFFVNFSISIEVIYTVLFWIVMMKSITYDQLSLILVQI